MIEIFYCFKCLVDRKWFVCVFLHTYQLGPFIPGSLQRVQGRHGVQVPPVQEGLHEQHRVHEAPQSPR